jgi:hypothetical protein
MYREKHTVENTSVGEYSKYTGLLHFAKGNAVIFLYDQMS